MGYINTYFSDFEQYNDTLGDWDLNYRLLSKNDFSANINRFSSDIFSLGRLSLNGTIEQKGQSPQGSLSFIIPNPNSSSFLFYNKLINNDTLLILPKNHLLDVVSHDGFDIYVINIDVGLIEEIVKRFFLNKWCESNFNNVQHVHLTKAFSQSFRQISQKFLNKMFNDEKQRKAAINHIISFILTYIEGSYLEIDNHLRSNKEIVLEKAVDIIDNNNGLYSIPQLCAIINVSERTLLYYFKEKYKVSTSEYIKAIRLNKVKRDIFLLKEKDTNISTIAEKYHFWHMGQFAKDFKKQFGILPSEYKNRIM